MIKHLRLFSTLLLLAVASMAWGEETLYYTLDGTIPGGNNAYADESDITQSDMVWKVAGNTMENPWRIGGKSLNGVNRLVYATTAMGSAISKVELEVGTASSITVNSLKLVVASDAEFKNTIDEVTATFKASSTITFTPTSGEEWATDAFYRFVFNVTVSGSKNKFVEFKGAKFYTLGETPSEPILPNVSFASSNVEVEVNGSYVNEITKPTDLNVSYSSSNQNVAEVTNDGTVTGKNVGEATITASWTAVENKYLKGSVSYNVSVVAERPKTYYEKVTDESQLVVGGEYIIVATDKNAAMGAVSSTSKFRSSVDKITIDEEGKVLYTNDMVVLTLGGENGAWTFKASDNNQYLSLTSSANELHSSASASDKTAQWVVTSDFNLQNAKLTDRKLLFNATTPRFACYTTAQTPSYLYVKYVERQDPAFSFGETTAFTVLPEADFTAPTLTYAEGYDGTISYSSDNEDVAIVDETTGEILIGNIEGTATITATGTATATFKAGTATYTITIQDNRQDAGLAWSADEVKIRLNAEEGSYTLPTLSNENNVEVSYSSNNEDVAMFIDGELVVVTDAVGNATITATFAGNAIYKPAKVSYTLSVYDPKGTIEDPYTVTEALDIIPETGTTENVFVKGIISQIDEVEIDKYHNATYWISDDGTQNSALEVYHGKFLNGENFTAEDQILVGDEVVVSGKLKKYEETKEFEAGNYLVSLIRTEKQESNLSFGEETTFNVNLNGDFTAPTPTYAEGYDGTITYSSDNEDVALVDEETGEVIIGSVEGSATITASASATNKFKASTATYTINVVDNRQEVTLTFTDVPATINVNETAIYTASATPAVEGIRYASNDENVVMVDETSGEIAALAAGTATITASFAGNDNYKKATASYTITVVDPNTMVVYQKVTSTDDITDGQYLIVNEEDAVAFNGGLETLDVASNTIGVTINDNKIAATEETDAAVFTIDVTAGTLKSASGKYIGVSSNSNGLKTSDDNLSYKNSFSIDVNGNAVISAVFTGSTMTLRFNSASGDNNYRFRYYKSGQQAIQLYKKISIPAEAVSISSAGMATFSSTKPLDFTGVKDIYAYTAQVEGSKVNFKRVNKVPANTGLLLRNPNGESAVDAQVPVIAETEAETVNNNALVAVAETIESLPTVNNENGGTNYILNKKGDNIGFYKAAGQKVGAGKAYLHVPAGVGVREFIGFDDETDGIEQIENGQLAIDNAEIYNLSGQRVNKAQKGIYIVNGKNVVVK